ncbi:hypothetical protein [Campylobacter sp. RM12651]|uniref:hypothetical protein n=1 Tax=Campylobacter sp. RM12651 TaxID=1660079 RepID=UPI001EFBE7E7|nr:hypothetical protein [Campylobacter sp. RM12651]ULO04589.1 hypothetical protein AVBRAN_a0107 [Campylobacter sp. RM12651]
MNNKVLIIKEPFALGYTLPLSIANVLVYEYEVNLRPHNKFKQDLKLKKLKLEYKNGELFLYKII